MYRCMICCWALLVAGLLFPVVESRAEDKPHEHAAHYLECAKACDDCARMCESCAAHCGNLLMQGKKEHFETLRTCQDCASFCSAASAITAKGGPFSDLICQSCADACKRCGDACAKFPDDEHMKKCAEECRRCEKACREMLQHLGAPAR